ncbi:MAG: phospholipase [Micavibrio aeruginosavorus]|uniref:Phospholipase n=1 Tax=Micavibrio aeruginosavorus TaxID=349221 RepID=A0A2W5HE72_9BACT|nr:MAG: phospholipase [Micavibrio aeruginosavorus]
MRRFFAKEREPLAGLRWGSLKSNNLHYCIDGVLPLGSCHHQKIAVIDDEVGYCGGMDIALARWDFREHHPVNKERKDPKGLLDPHHVEPFAPYHDLMMVTAGNSARALAELFRDRWNLACDDKIFPLSSEKAQGLPTAWPDSDPPDFENVDIAIARTLPPVKRQPRREEIFPAYLAEISKAEKFIYIENQFLVQIDIARALNKRLREKPELRVLAISCDLPKGIMERKSMWAPRLKFREIIESGGVADRVALVHPVSRENGKEDPVRIHSKLMIIDDKFLHLGSANINNRSMGFDTECDQILIGQDQKSRKKISDVRTDLIREHSGREALEIGRLVDSFAPINDFLEEVPTSRQHFKRINDEAFRKESFVQFAKMIADPRRPLISADITIPLSRKHFGKHFSKPWVWLFLALLTLAAVSGIAFANNGPDWLSLKNITGWLSALDNSAYTIPIILGLFVISSLIMFPITILIAATSAALGPLAGFLLSITGTLLSACIGYGIGRKLGFSKIIDVFGKKTETLRNQLNKRGTSSVAVIRMLPILPFGLMNMLFGINAIPFRSYLAGTFLGILPGTITLAFLGSSLFKVISSPSPQNIIFLFIGVAVWILLLILSHRLESKLHRKAL